MSETKRVPTWGEIFKVEQAIEAIEGASASVTRAGMVIEEASTVLGRLGNLMEANNSAIRALRDWCATTRLARESEDLERKKAGLA